MHRRTVVVLAGLGLLAAAAAAVALWRAGRRPPPPQTGWPEWPAPPAAFVTDIGTSEAANEDAAKSVKQSFMRGLRTLDWTKVSQALTDDFRGRFPAPSSGARIGDGVLEIEEYRDAAIPEVDGPGLVEAFRRHTDGWTSVERAVWRPFEFRLRQDGAAARLALHFQVAGPRPDGCRTDLQAVVDAEVVKAGDSWRIRRLAVREGCRITGRRPPFREITDPTGFHFNESVENRKLLQEVIDARNVRTNSGLSAVDWNHDGFWDLLAARYASRAVVFVNDGRGGFNREELDLGGPDQVGAILLYLDLDGDGREELVGSRPEDLGGSRFALPVYVREPAGTWTRRPALEFEVRAGRRDVLIQAVVPFDVNSDGLLDLWFGAYSDSDSGKENFNSLGSFDGADNLLFINRGGLRFTEESDARGLTGTQYTYAGLFFDFDGDGRKDLYECNDWGPNVLFRGEEGGRFRKVEHPVLTEASAYSMGVTVADTDNTGLWSVYVSNMYSHAGNRIVPLAGGISGATRAAAFILARGNMLYERAADGSWRETAVERGVAWADWAWGCLYADFDNDTDQDLFVANGFTTNSDPSAPDW